MNRTQESGLTNPPALTTSPHSLPRSKDGNSTLRQLLNCPDSTEAALRTLYLCVHLSSCLTLALSFTSVDALHDSVSDLTGFIPGAAVGFTGHPLGRSAGAALLALVGQNRLIRLFEKREKNTM